MKVLTAVALLLAAAAGPSPLAPSQPSDLDAFMAKVLERRDENWKKLQQYVLEEDEQLHITGPDGTRVYGFDRHYTWFIRDGVFIRSPLEFDGVKIAEGERTRFEREWIEREKRRERRAQERAKAEAEGKDEPDAGGAVSISPRGVEISRSESGDVAQSLEPRFVSAAYFLRFKFDPGHYALAGRETLDGREVLRIEYYPSKLFTEGRTRPSRRARERDDQIEEKMNKVSLVTLWVDPSRHQILQYTFDNIDMDFLPGRALIRFDELKASMKMRQAFPDVWLPGQIEMKFGVMTALGALSARYDVAYRDHRLASVTSKIRPPQ